MGTSSERDRETDVRGRRERDMVLSPNEYVHVLDETKGDVALYHGPNKTSLATTDVPVTYDPESGRFRSCDLSQGTRSLMMARVGEYIVLENPAADNKFPRGSGKLSAPELNSGKKVNITGPSSFALWPGQTARVVPGHNLRSNEYLLVRVYDEEAARSSWNSAVIKTQAVEGAETNVSKPKDIPTAGELSMGKLFVIKGTEVSFYIPPTGVEVVPEVVGGEERYVREAVSLEALEYALLLDQDGKKRYVHGPAVVVPSATERFVEAATKSAPDRAKARKFRFQELTPQSGIHIRVIADYEDEKTHEKHAAGEELFITGDKTSIYAPRAEHAIVKNGDADLHFAVVIPRGEGRYVLDKDKGEVELVKGPKTFLPDPRKQIIVNKVLPPNICELMYPGNEEAKAVNLARMSAGGDGDFYSVGATADSNSTKRSVESSLEAYDASSYASNASFGSDALGTGASKRQMLIRQASKSLPGDSFDRKGKFTPPRSIVINSKYDGAVTTDIYGGYAMMLVSKSGARRVVVGPQTAMHEYDETPQVMSLSTGKPKTTDNLYKTVYLLTHANAVSDIITVETRDFCKLRLKLVYRVNFEGEDKERWFKVDNYVKFLTDTMRSRIRAAVKRLNVEKFYGDHTPFLRDVILGERKDGAERPGTPFSENGMRIYDVEVLDVEIEDHDVKLMLVKSQRDEIQQTLSLASAKRQLESTAALEAINRSRVEMQEGTKQANNAMVANTKRLEAELAMRAVDDKLRTDSAEMDAQARRDALRIQNDMQTARGAADAASLKLDAELRAAEAKLGLDVKSNEAKIELARKSLELELQRIEADVKAVVAKADAVTPDMVAALQAFGDKALVERVAQSMAPMALIGGKSVVDVLRNLLDGSPLAKYLAASEAAQPDHDPSADPQAETATKPAARGRRSTTST